VVLLKVGYLKICQHAKLHGPTLTGASFASTSEVINVHHFGTVEATGLEIMALMSPSMS
jgi:hypothetical protein